MSIKNFTPRLYQETIFNACTSKNSLVVLPTGMGKTNVFLMLAAHRLKLYPNSKILFIGPTKPLIDQYMQVFKNHFEIEEDKMAIFTGMIKPEKRAELWKTAKIIFSTPQGLENDIINNRIKLEDISLLGVDEAHRAVGDYAYVFVAQQYIKKSSFPRIMALTASPGSDMEKIQEVCKNLYIENIEIRTEESPDVKQYIQEVKIDWVKVTLPPKFDDVQKFLKEFLKRLFEKIGIYPNKSSMKDINGNSEIPGLLLGKRNVIGHVDKGYTLIGQKTVDDQRYLRHAHFGKVPIISAYVDGIEEVYGIERESMVSKAHDITIKFSPDIETVTSPQDYVADQEVRQNINRLKRMV